MPLWRLFSSGLLLLVCIAVPLQGALAVEDECTKGTGEANAPDYVPGPTEAYTLEQPFGGKATIATIGEYIQTVYSFALGIVGIIAVVLIMFGGLRWVSAAGNETTISDAKEIITSAISGLAIALLSYVILAFLNPQTLQTDVSIFKIPIPTSCPETTLVTISDFSGLDGNGAQACPNLVSALNAVATKMRTDSSSYDTYCPTCTIHVGSAYRTPESQEGIYACYLKCVDEGYISSDGVTHYKSGAPSGCDYCAKAAPTCCSNHVQGLAVDLYYTNGGYDTFNHADLPSSYAGDQTKNNGLSGGTVDYGPDCSTRADRRVCESQKKLYKIMYSTGQFTNYNKEWWHFDYTGECGDVSASTTCSAVSSGECGATTADNSYCFATKSDGTPMYRCATCTDGVAGCQEGWGGYTWYTASTGSGCEATSFSSATPEGTLSQTYTTKPSCYIAPATAGDASTF